MKSQSGCGWVPAMFLTLACSLFGLWLFVPKALDEPTLQKEGRVIDVAVTEAVVSCRLIVFCSNQVTYNLPANDYTYKETEDVSAATYNRARSARQISVIYVPDKPWMHHVAEASALSVMFWNGIGGIISVVVLGVSVVGGIQMGVEYLRRPKAPPEPAEFEDKLAPKRLPLGLSRMEWIILIIGVIAIACVSCSLALAVIMTVNP
jgi:hypothetical protein